MKKRISLLVLVAAAFSAAALKAQSGDLIAAAKRGDLAAVNNLLRAGADVNERKFGFFGGSYGEGTALMQASAEGHVEVVQALLAAKAAVNATISEKKDGETALTLAVRKDHVEVVRALLAAGADVDHPSDEATALYAAARAANLNMVKVLLTAKPDLNRRSNISGNTALMYGISTGTHDSPEIARLLIEAGANVNLSNSNGVTALTLAVQRTLPTVQLLLAAGANVDSRWCTVAVSNPPLRPVVFSYDLARGTTALTIASSLGKADIVQALLAAKADANLAQCDGKTPLALALEHGHQEVADLLRRAGAVAP